MLPLRLPAHRVLLVEDDPGCRETAVAYLTARGDSVRAVATVKEAFAAMQEEDFCAYVLDQELPHTEDDAAFVSNGRRLVEAVRRADSRRTSDGAFVTPVRAWTGFSSHPEFVWLMKDLGVCGFIPKGEGGAESFQNELTKRFALAGRADHAACARLVLPTSLPEEPPVTLAILGTKDGTLTTVEINDQPRGMQDGKVVVLLRFVLVHERRKDEWSDRDALGIGESRETISRVRAVFRGLVPDGFDVIQKDLSGRFRLHPPRFGRLRRLGGARPRRSLRRRPCFRMGADARRRDR